VPCPAQNFERRPLAYHSTLLLQKRVAENYRAAFRPRDWSTEILARTIPGVYRGPRHKDTSAHSGEFPITGKNAFRGRPEPLPSMSRGNERMASRRCVGVNLKRAPKRTSIGCQLDFARPL